MLDRIRLQNFKTHRDTEIKLGRLTVLVGPNGAGKSSVLQAIQMVPGIDSDQMDASVGPNLPWDAMRTRPSGSEEIGACTIHFAGSFDGGGRWEWTPDPGRARRDQWLQIAPELQSALLAPNPARMRDTIPITKITPSLDSDGSGLAEVVASMRDEDSVELQALQTAIHSVVPQVERIGVRRTIHPKGFIGYELIFDVSGRKGIPASQMSGGTLLALAILALLHSPQRPRILLLDDIDHALHPKAQWDLLKQLRRLLAQYPDLQIVATSHSPDLVDELAPSEVIVMALRPDGTSAAKPLTACPREDMLGVLRAGQLWSAVGEEWVTLESPLEAELRA